MMTPINMNEMTCYGYELNDEEKKIIDGIDSIAIIHYLISKGDYNFEKSKLLYEEDYMDFINSMNENSRINILESLNNNLGHKADISNI